MLRAVPQSCTRPPPPVTKPGLYLRLVPAAGGSTQLIEECREAAAAARVSPAGAGPRLSRLSPRCSHLSASLRAGAGWPQSRATPGSRHARGCRLCEWCARRALRTPAAGAGAGSRGSATYVATACGRVLQRLSCASRELSGAGETKRLSDAKLCWFGKLRECASGMFTPSPKPLHDSAISKRQGAPLLMKVCPWVARAESEHKCLAGALPGVGAWPPHRLCCFVSHIT